MNTTQIKPIPLILFSQESRSYLLTPEAHKLFSSIPSHHSISVITILGPYRTGKSLLLNRVLLSKSQGFEVGNTVNSCTKGLWLYAVNGKDFLKGLAPGETSGLTEDSTVLIIDTEGFGSVNVNQNYDNRVFLMALLLSSLVIYNSMGTIDENALNQLALITSLSNEIQSKLDAPITMPYFIWILRDFMLKLEDKLGNKITSKDYLENSLEIQKGVSEIVEKKNKVRRMFNHYFPDRECVTLMRPIEGEEELGKLNELDDHMIRKEFIDQLQALKVKIMKKSCPKTIITDSKTKQTKPIIGGTMFMSLCTSFLEVINEGKITKIESIWTRVSADEAKKAISRSLESFDKIKQRFLKDSGLKEMGKESLISCRKAASQEMLVMYTEKIKHLDITNQDGLLKNLIEGINDKFTRFEKENKANWIKRYEQFIESHMEKFESTALEHDNYFDFREELNKLEEKFMKEMLGGMKKKKFFGKVSLKLWIKYIENYARKNKQDRQKLDAQKTETMELLKLVRDRKSSENHKNDNATEKQEKQELSKLFVLLQTQLQESKQVQDQILTSIKDQKEQKDFSQNQSFLIPPQQPQILIETPIEPSPSPIDEKVMETNRYLSMALQKLEGLYKNQEIKLKKYKEFKKMLNFAAYIECIQCHGLFKPNEFMEHANNCKVVLHQESPEINNKFDFLSNFYQNNDSFSTTLTTIPQIRGTASLLPNYEQNSMPMTYASQLNRDIDFELEREEQKKAKSFFYQESKPPVEEFDESNDLIYNMPRPLIMGGMKKHETKGLLNEESEIITSHTEENHHKNLNFPYVKQEIGNSTYWENSLIELMGKKQFYRTGEEKFQEFNTTLIPDGEIKTMSFVKTKSRKGSSKGSNGNLHENEEQNIKGLTNGQKEYFDRGNSWNAIYKNGDLLRKTLD